MTEVITLMKIFKRVYYPILAALVVLMLVLGMVDSRVGMSGGNLADSKVNAARSEEHTSELQSPS